MAKTVIDQRTESAVFAFKAHDIVRKTDNSYLLMKNYPDGKPSFEYYTEVISLYNGGLFVGGDIDVCVFAYYKGNLEEKIHWIGKLPSPDSYVREKASIGLGSSALTVEYCSRTAKEDLLYYKENEELTQEQYKALLDVIDDREEVYKVLSEFHDDYWEWKIGEIITCRVIYAWAALKRLCELLKCA